MTHLLLSAATFSAALFTHKASSFIAAPRRVLGAASGALTLATLSSSAEAKDAAETLKDAYESLRGLQGDRCWGLGDCGKEVKAYLGTGPKGKGSSIQEAVMEILPKNTDLKDVAPVNEVQDKFKDLDLQSDIWLAGMGAPGPGWDMADVLARRDLQFLIDSLSDWADAAAAAGK